jgi:alpha-1,3-glucosyltransferase
MSIGFFENKKTLCSSHSVVTEKTPIELTCTDRTVSLIRRFHQVLTFSNQIVCRDEANTGQKTSEWTLDYPPFFAYFEWALSRVAQYVDPLMLQIKNMGYDSWATIYFQRASVIISEFILIYALHRFIQSSTNKKTAHASALAIFLSPGLLIIDHIHFQYNGAMYGLLILSIVYAQQPSTLLESGLLFAALLCFKHIYLYLAPAYFVYLLRAYCLSPRSIFSIQWSNSIRLGLGILTIFVLAFGPFAYWGQIPQVLSRLFPFSRGLCHAYWAPNVWAMYSFTDRVLIVLAPYLHLPVNHSALHSVTRGLVGDTSFAVLPEITPRMTFLLTLATQLPALGKLFLYPTTANFLPTLTVTAYSSFLFGWHVHEKAILLILLPFTLLCLRDRRWLAAYRPLAVAGHVSLFPLLFTHTEFPIKTVYTLFWLISFLAAFDHVCPAASHPRLFLLDRFAVLYVAVAVPLVVYCSALHGVVFGSGRFEFVPLMFISSYSALGVVGSWVGFLVVFFSE